MQTEGAEKWKGERKENLNAHCHLFQQHGVGLACAQEFEQNSKTGTLSVCVCVCVRVSKCTYANRIKCKLSRGQD